MNATRRKNIDVVRAKLAGLKIEIETLQTEEQDYHDAMPESIQAGEKGDTAQSTADALQAAAEAIDDVEDNLAEAMNQ